MMMIICNKNKEIKGKRDWDLAIGHVSRRRRFSEKRRISTVETLIGGVVFGAFFLSFTFQHDAKVRKIANLRGLTGFNG